MPGRRRVRGLGGMTADGGSSGRSPSWGTRATGVGSVSPSGRSASGDGAGLELVEEVQHARPALGGVVELDVQVRDAPDAERPPQLVTDERHRPLQGGDRGVAFGGLADDADPHLGVAEVARRLDLRDRDETHPGIGDIAGHDGTDLLPEEFVDPVGTLGHEPAGLSSTERG